MSKKQNITRAIALSLLLAVPCYEVANAAPGQDSASKTEEIVIGSSGADSTYRTDNGTDGSTIGERGGNAGDLSVTATITDTVNGNIKITGIAGNGGKGGNGGAGGAGGDTEVHIQMSFSPNATVTVQDITIKATGGNGGAGGAGGAGGNATAYGVQTAADSNLTITTADISVTATGGKGGFIDTFDEAAGGAGGTAIGYGVQAASDSILTVTTDSISVTATGGGGGGGSQNLSNVAGAGGAATAYGAQAAADSILTVTTDSISVTATGGAGGAVADGGYTAPGGAGGAATAYGAQAASESNLTVTAAAISVTATGGQGGYSNEDNGGAGGAATAYGAQAAADSILTVTTDSISVTATSGNGEYMGGAGGAATAYGAQAAADSILTVTTDSISVTATGGKGEYAGGAGGAGGAATAYGAQAASESNLTVTAAAISVTATGGQGGYANEGNGGAGGTATAYGAQAAADSILTVTTDSISVTATGGKGEYAGGGGAAATDGQGTAYGVYAEQGATITLAGKTADNALDIGVTATGLDAKAYAAYVDNGSVLFASSANLNKDATLAVDNTVTTYLQDSTLGFVDTAAGTKATGRTVTGGILELAGSNTFRFATDLRNNTADSMTYNSLAANSTSETQYITIAYDKSFDGSDLSTITGQATVLHFDNLNSNDLTKFEAKQSAFDTPLESFIATPIISVGSNDVTITSVDFGQNGPSESVMAASDVHMALGGIWRAETNNLMKRMGELRSDPDVAKGGVWARYYRGKQSANGAYARSFEQTYTGFQAGIDRTQAYKDGRLVTGLMVNRIDATASYHAGNGEMSSTGMGLYASWLGNKGHYLDVIARLSKLNNNFKLTDKSSNFASGDYSTWAYGISAEYGYRQQLQAGWFIEPQAELTFSHINSADYTMSNGLQAKHDAVNSTIGRIGFMTGKAFQANGRAGNAYIKASLLHEFGGKEGGRAYYQGKGIEMANGDLGGTWYELGIGANLGLSRNANLYMDLLKTFNGKIKTDWQFNAGVRVSF